MVGVKHKGRLLEGAADLTACLLVKHKGVVAGQAQEPDCLASVPDPTAHQLFILSPSCLIVK